jgi:hypothetical protein
MTTYPLTPCEIWCGSNREFALPCVLFVSLAIKDKIPNAEFCRAHSTPQDETCIRRLVLRDDEQVREDEQLWKRNDE